MTPCLTDEPAHCRKAKVVPLVLELCAPERFAYLRDGFRLHPTPSVLDRDADIVAGGNTSPSGDPGFGEGGIIGANADHPALRHRIAGIQHQVDERAFELPRIRECQP